MTVLDIAMGVFVGQIFFSIFKGCVMGILLTVKNKEPNVTVQKEKSNHRDNNSRD